MLVLEVGLSPATINEGPGAIAEALSERLGGDWRALAEHLEQTRRADAVASSAKDALVLVRALAEDSAAIRRALLPAATKLMAGA
jgi:DNA-binding transcriptional ArsR family regulator